MDRGGKALIASRNRRLIRFRSVAPPTFFVTVNPTRGTSSAGSGRRIVWMENSAAWVLRPFAALRNSGLVFSRSGAATCEISAGLSAVRGWIRRTNACGRAPDALRSPGVRRPSPCAPGTHGVACARSCWVGRSVSRSSAPVRQPSSRWPACRSRITGRVMDEHGKHLPSKPCQHRGGGRAAYAGRAAACQIKAPTPAHARSRSATNRFPRCSTAAMERSLCSRADPAAPTTWPDRICA